MKVPLHAWLVSGLLLAACSTESTPSTPVHVSPPVAQTRPSVESPTQTVQAFLHWYAQHLTQLNTLPTVPAAIDADPTNVYAVDFQAVEHYLRLLQSSGKVTPAYLLAHRHHFQQSQDSLQAAAQTDGPPFGLDYDRVLYTQDAEGQVQLLLRSRPVAVLVRQDSAQVRYQWQESEMSEGPNLTFSLVQDHGQWLINAIRPN